jgi:hypothetical protein
MNRRDEQGRFAGADFSDHLRRLAGLAPVAEEEEPTGSTTEGFQLVKASEPQEAAPAAEAPPATFDGGQANSITGGQFKRAEDANDAIRKAWWHAMGHGAEWGA